MRIAFLSYAFGHHAYGAGKYGWHLTDELRKMGHHVDVFSPNVHLSKTGPFLFSFKNLFRKLKNYDVIHSNEGAGLFLTHPNMLETYHHDYAQIPEFGHRFFSIFENIECNKAKHIIVPSYASQDSLLHYGFPPEKISVIYHGVDKIFKEDDLTRKKMRSKLGLSDRFVVINVGRLVKHKRQVELIEAIKGIPNLVLILVGKGDEEQTIYEAASKAGVKLLHFKDVATEFLVGLYNAADAYVHTSAIEGFGLTIVEAMACGLPIVAYKTADLEKIVETAGFLSDVGDIEGINHALHCILENTELKAEMEKAASNRSKMFSWSESARRHSQLYTAVLAKNL